MASPVKDILNLRSVCNELSAVEHKTYKIGIQLGIPRSKMEMFKKEEDMLSAVIDYWLSGNVEDVPATWESLVRALESKQVGETQLARAITVKFRAEETDDSDQEDDDGSSSSDMEPLSPDVKMDLEQKLNQNLKLIKKQYAAYLDRILMIVHNKGVTAKRLSLYLLSLSASTDDERKLQLLSEMKAELKEAEDVSDIFILLSSKYASFLDYDIFASILEQFGGNEPQEEHEDLKYPSHLMTYIELHKIKEFTKLNPKLLQKEDSQSELIKIKLNIKRTQNLKCLKEVVDAVANILGVKASALRLYCVKKGCVLVKLLINISIANAIFSNEMVFTDKQNRQFQKASVLWLKCSGHNFDFRAIDPKESSVGHFTAVELGPVESVRKKLKELYITSINNEEVIATPLLRAIESCNTDNVRNLFRNQELRLKIRLFLPKREKNCAA